MTKKLPILLSAVLLLFFANCKQAYQPKPYAYPRIFYPERNYVAINENCPFQFDVPVYTQLVPDPYNPEASCWKNLVFEPFNATVHLTYNAFNSVDQLDQYVEDTYKMAFKHIEKAEEIVEREFENKDLGLKGIIYDLEGKTATPFNFYITDSKSHFIRGSFYFNEKTNLDSVAPIYEFIRTDINYMMETLRFK
jgi:gliding motility-associated lipoprotein GldD